MTSRSIFSVGVSLALLVAVAAALGQSSPLLQLTNIQLEPGQPTRFIFTDQGTGSTNYVVEFAPAIGAPWSDVAGAAIVPRGGRRVRRDGARAANHNWLLSFAR